MFCNPEREGEVALDEDNVNRNRPPEVVEIVLVDNSRLLRDQVRDFEHVDDHEEADNGGNQEAAQCIQHFLFPPKKQNATRDEVCVAEKITMEHNAIANRKMFLRNVRNTSADLW